MAFLYEYVELIYNEDKLCVEPVIPGLNAFDREKQIEGYNTVILLYNYSKKEG